MIIAEWSCDIPKEKLEEFLKYSKEVLKPFWESHGVASYSVYQYIDKQYFPYQELNAETRIIEHLCFNTIKDFEKFLKISHDKTKEENKIRRSYGDKFNVTNTIFRVYQKR